MTTEALKSGSITDLDGGTLGVPPVRHVAGSGAAGTLRDMQDQVTATTGKTSGSTYQMIRLPSTVILKKLEWWVEATVTTFANDVDLYYSDSPYDGTKVANQGTVAANQLFGAAVDMHTAAAPADLAYANLLGDKLNQPLWQAAGLSADPGGQFDIVLKNTSTNSGAPVVHVRATYVVAD